MNRSWSLLAISIVAAISGCGGGSVPPPPAVSIALSTMPPAWLGTGGAASVAATVQNDSSASGVNWSCTPANACGAFNPTSTPSGTATMYTAPAAVPTGGSVTIVATSVTDSSKRATAAVVISGTASNATLKGQYAFLIMAPTGNATTRGTTTFVGSVNLDGNGNILGGMEDIVSTVYRDQEDPIIPTSVDAFSSYSVDPSGHGTMAFHTKNQEALSFSFVLTSASHAVVIETGQDPGSGTLDLQSGPFATSQIFGGYSFTLEGVDTFNPPTAEVAFGGVFSADLQGNITGMIDSNIGGTVTSETFTGSILVAPDTNGRGQLLVVPPGTTRTFTFYMVSPKVLRLFEADNVDLTGGSAYAQGSATATLSGKFAYEHSGWTSTGRAVAAGQLAANGTSSITGGVSDANLGGAAPTTPSLAMPVTGTFAFTNGLEGTLTLADAAGNSTFNVYLVDPSLNVLDPNFSSSGGGGALLLHTDANIIGTGRLIPQTASSPPAIVGNQGLNLQNSVAASTTNELDLVGAVSSDGSGNLTNGAADYDQTNSPNAAGPFTGTFAADGANPGRFTGSFTVPTPSGAYPFIPPSVTTFNVSFYAVSNTQLLVIQTDNAANISGRLFQQRLP